MAELEQQIRITGSVVKSDTEISDLYFNSRPKGSQIAASASNQSSLIFDRTILKMKLIVWKNYMKIKMFRDQIIGVAIC